MTPEQPPRCTRSTWAVGVEVFISPTTIGTAFLFGLASLALAPILLKRRIYRMDVSAELRTID